MAKGKVGALGQLYGSIVTAPFKLANLPFKSHRQYYGKPKPNEKYDASFIQKQRLKKLLPLVFSGKNISPNDRLFLNMFNDFMTSEGHKAVDQKTVDMRCDYVDECSPYIYDKINVYKNDVDSEEDDEIVNQNNGSTVSRVDIKFLSELKPKDTKKSFKVNNMYGFNVISYKKTSSGVEIQLKNSFLKDYDYLILKSPVKNINNRPISYSVSQNNSNSPLNTDIDLGSVSAKISF
jgi:hypothetical protein